MVATLAVTMSRRQNSSCDQCRKGKRACDAVWLRDRQIQTTIETNGPKGSPGLLSHGGPAPGPDDDFDLVGPCTNCARTNKHCTFEWVQSQQLQRKERLATSNASTAPAPKKGGTAGTGLDAQSTETQSPAPSSMPLRPLRPSMMPATFNDPAQYSFSPHEQQILMDSCPYPTPNPAEGFKMPTSDSVTGVAFVDGSLTTNPTSMGMPCTTSCLNLDTIATTAQPSSSAYMNVDVLGSYGLDPFGTGPAPTSGYNEAPIDSGVSAAWSSPVAPSINSPTELSTDDHQLGMQQMRKRRRTQSPARMNGVVQQTPLWDIFGGNRLARSANSVMIGETMMRIYHDVMEGALSCWLTEQTCPYNSLPSTPSSTSTSSTGMSATTGHSNNPQQQLWGTFEDMQHEWGANWSNRIYRRVIKLDKMAHMLGLKRLAPADERRVSAALNAAVMAFTAQWAQSSQRSTARWPPDEEHDFRPPDLGEEFDRTLQKSFWNQARQSLSECSEIDSFRVVFAEIVFGLTQKYRDDTGSDDRGMGRPDGSAEDANVTSETVEEILREDTQQIWLERATRRLHVLRRRVELHDRQMRNKKDSDSSAYDAECRKTIDLLFWLAIMFDTISAAMTERPLTVSDEDSSNLALTHSTHQSPMLNDPSKRWNVILAKDQQTKLSSLRWPCTDAEIAQELTDAAPVKVLLYRKVTLLQTLVARAADARSLEEAISDTLMVYRHWQAIYSAIFADCLTHHMLLSARIQSWYVCLFGHWLLATLMVAELVEIVDARDMGGEVEARRRAEEGTVAGIRRDTVSSVAALAKASTPQHDEITGAGELDNFHHAVSDGALLTEPWTMILLRTFSKAAILLLEESVNATKTRDDRLGQHTRCLEKCQDCIKALWYLGRKSDMAREVSQVLDLALQRARMKALHGQ
ncbi:hypothetical protein N0V93_002814 [Gnomoniopsis smithogilvyi]|uniref:Zn(2)-C6 fungal-type domain-containing protein n=1 Tax=Gnomoniopsis smithogilvyi TaxID=1191159 RepID=A0A9W8YXG3_9PEZI|nr:hypothetical protein N0V93_002814 [Gnomoniopsis smithogilvyi]